LFLYWIIQKVMEKLLIHSSERFFVWIKRQQKEPI